MRHQRDRIIAHSSETRSRSRIIRPSATCGPSKTQQKISGRLTSDDTTQDRYDIRSYIDTARKHGTDVLTAPHALSPAIPGYHPFPASA